MKKTLCESQDVLIESEPEKGMTVTVAGELAGVIHRLASAQGQAPEAFLRDTLARSVDGAG